MPTGQEVINDALIDLGYLAAGESPTTAETTFCLSRLNDWIDALGVERLTMYYVLRTTKTLTASTASYTIGSGGNIDIQRPTYLDPAMQRIIPDINATIPVELRIPVLTDLEYASYPTKTLTAPLSTAIYYDHNWSSGLGRIYVLPIPTVSTTQLVLYTPQATATFANTTTNYTFPPGYRRFLRLGLATELWQSFGQLGNIEALTDQFVQARADIKRANYRPEAMPMDPAASGTGGGVYSIYSDSTIR